MVKRRLKMPHNKSFEHRQLKCFWKTCMCVPIRWCTLIHAESDCQTLFISKFERLKPTIFVPLRNGPWSEVLRFNLMGSSNFGILLLYNRQLGKVWWQSSMRKVGERKGRIFANNQFQVLWSALGCMSRIWFPHEIEPT